MLRKNILNNKYIFIVVVLLILIQAKTINLKNTYSFTPSQLDQHIQRMNYYPPQLAKLGYILEKKVEIRLVEKFVENFIETVDFNTYFPNYFPIVTLPFFLIGIYKYFSRRITDPKFVLIFISSIFIQSFFGNKGKIGPVIILPFILFFILEGMSTLIIFTKSYVKK